MDGFYTSLFITWTKDWGSTYLFLLYLQEDIPIPNITTEKLYISIFNSAFCIPRINGIAE